MLRTATRRSIPASRRLVRLELELHKTNGTTSQCVGAAFSSLSCSGHQLNEYKQSVKALAPSSVHIRSFSDKNLNLLGYSPMSPPPHTPASGSSSTSGGSSGGNGSGVPSAQDVSLAGGVWAPTSAKRDKLAELKTEMFAAGGQLTLDVAASEPEKLDLYLADGIACIVRTADSVAVQPTAEAAAAALAAAFAPLKAMDDWLTEQSSTKLNRLPTDLHQVQWEEYLKNVVAQVDSVLSTLPADRYLWKVRDFYDVSGEAAAAAAAAGKDQDQDNKAETTTADTDAISELQQDVAVSDTFQQSVVRFRLLLTKAAAEHMLNSWKTITAVSDQDIDRAAVLGETLESHRSTLSMEELHCVLRAYLTGTCKDRVDAVWKLLDRDHDSLLDEAEMNLVSRTTVEPVRTALSTLMKETLDAYPVRAPLPAPDATRPDNIPRPGWRQRRREAKAKKKLTKMFQKTLKKHFDDEVEMAHRLRCIYAWAEKAHQDNKISSIQVEEMGWSGRQRHVELNPKISFSEFLEVQQVHFTHLDRIGAEYLKSFREDLWVAQGKGRQNRELQRDCGIFLAVVCLIDFVVIAL
jgi:hypothetical protein